MLERLSCPSEQNYLVHTLSVADRAALEPHLFPVELPERMVLDEPGAPIRTAVFPTSGVGSMITSGADDRRIETGLFGHEGMSGMALVIGGDRLPSRTIMQVAGAGCGIGAARLVSIMEARPSLRAHLLRFMQAMYMQASQTALSNGHATLEERLARWLLMCHDRIQGDMLALTHELLSVMLGVRRAGVTVGTQVLEGKGLIRASRGRIAILNRSGLERQAQGSYGRSEAEYDRLFAPAARRSDRMSGARSLR